MRRIFLTLSIIVLSLFFITAVSPVVAQEATPTPTPGPLTFFTDFPSQVVGLGETVSIDATLRGGKAPQVVQLETVTVPQGWTVTFRGQGKIIKSAFVQPSNDSNIEIRLEPPKDEKSGDYTFVVRAKGETEQSELTIQLTVQEKLPPSISLSCDLPTLTGSPTTTFRYNVTLKNDGSDEPSVNLTANAPDAFQVKFRLAGQEITNLPLPSKDVKNLSIEVSPVADVAAGTYPIKIIAQGSEASAELDLTAEVTGQASLTVTAPDGRLSGQAYAGKDSSIKVTIRNDGSAPARGIELSASEPSGWTVTFDPTKIDEIGPNQQVDVTAHIRPGDKAVAGDYMVDITAKPSEGASKTAEFRITVLTSTLWGIVGVILIAIAVGVVALAVMRFGRR
ncbi:MAG: NEW3 domain-containing protein [Anaerolineales bacterium]